MIVSIDTSNRERVDEFIRNDLIHSYKVTRRFDDPYTDRLVESLKDVIIYYSDEVQYDNFLKSIEEDYA